MNEERLRDAWEALRTRRPSEALAILEALEETGRPGYDGRLHAWRAEALEALGRLDRASAEATRAIRIARAAEDADALNAFRALNQRILASLAAVQLAEQERKKDAHLADVDEAQLIAGLDGPARAAALTRRAQALIDAERRAEAVEVARRAFGAADGDPREQVLALLCETRAEPDRALLLLARAHAVADAADDPNLIAAVARAARGVGVRLPSPEFG